MRVWKALALVVLIAVGLGAAACNGGDEKPPARGAALEDGAQEPLLPENAQALSFLGDTLFPPPLADEVLSRRAQQLEEALRDLDAHPEDADAIIWAGRRYAYLGDYRKAIQLFTDGIRFHPEDARLYRHRGHRYITVRELDKALEDFRTAADLIQGTEDEVEPDGQPNASGIPTSTLHFNIWYHYGLALFLKGDFEAALPIYRRCMESSVHPDSKVATAHWLYMTLRRLGREDEAGAFLREMDLDALAPEVIESGAYLELLRLYARAEENPDEALPELGPGTVEGAALGYGVGDFLLYNGHPDRAREVFREILSDRDQWAAFGYIAAEADLARMEGLGGP